MNKIIGVTEMQRQFRAVFDEVARKRVPYVLTRGSRPEAALIPYEDYLLFQELQEGKVLARFDRLKARLAEESAKYGSAEETVAVTLTEEARLALDDAQSKEGILLDDLVSDIKRYEHRFENITPRP